MNSIAIAAEREYEVAFVENWQQRIEAIIANHDKVAIIAPQSLTKLLEISQFATKQVLVLQTPEGEAAKSVSYLAEAWSACSEFGLTRSDCIIGIGGGSTTDLAGFVAATWLRGISWHAVPTSLAGMVDAAIGGKTGINADSGKNLIGSFYSPSSVTIDLHLLKTLSERDFNAGMAEIIKCGFIADPQILKLASDVNGVESNIAELVYRSIAVKADVVSADFRESKLREILNYGHTLGHAIEKFSGYTLRHGEAISIGLVFAAELGNLIHGLDPKVVTEHRNLLAKFKLPITFQSAALPELLELMASDKKVRGGALRFIALSDVAKPVWLEDVTVDQITKAYERISA